MDPNIIYKLAIWALPILLAITLHEAGHAWAANKLGDNTAKNLGRVSINPLPHIDPVGTIILPLLMYLTSPIIFGWAKPVPVSTHKLHKPRRDMALVAIAGPGANFIMMLCWALLFKIVHSLELTNITQGVAHMALAGMFINLLLAFFNLLPLPPLDGGRVLVSLLPANLAIKLAKVERFGILIVLALFFIPSYLKLPGLGQLMMYLIINTQALFLSLFGVDNAGSEIIRFLENMVA